MGLDVPELDDRTYEEYLDQAKKLIPSYSDEWTDFNPHDPGITILEVLAWLTETHAYQLDQVSDDHREKYLGLLGERRRRQRPATTRLSLDPPPEAVGERVPAGTTLFVTDGPGETRRFETDADAVLTDASVTRVVTAGATDRTDNTQENATEGMYYRPFGNPVERGDAVYLGFDRDPFDAAQSLTLTVEYHEADLPEPTPVGPDDHPFVPSVELTWAYRPPEGDRWVELTAARDETDALYRGGAVELSLPAGDERAPAARPPDEPLAPDRGWIRCRVETPGYEVPPQVRAIEPNVVAASHAVGVTDERLEQVAALGEPTALDGQVYEFAHGPVLDADVRVDGEPFVEVPDFDASRPDDRHYVVDREAARVRFGDGEHGRAPAAGATVTADYTYGGGTAGNVSPEADWRFAPGGDGSPGPAALADVGVTATAPVTGGEDRETIAAAFERVRRDMQTPYRGVTVEDYERVAARTPGVRVGRTAASVDDGTVTVVVVPYAPGDVARPEPSDGFLRAVRRHVAERSVLSDCVEVRGPTYVGLDVAVTGRARPRYADGGTEDAVRAAIESFVHPLVGHDGDGWPFGRTLDATVLEARISALDVVDRVTDVSLTAHGGTVVDDERVLIGDRALFTVTDVTVDVTTGRSNGGWD